MKRQICLQWKVSIESFRPVYTEDDFKDPDFTSSTGNTTGETGNLGVTYMPTNGSLGKADAEIQTRFMLI